ncbi:MAG: hypothetical protein HYZ54_01720 [Ignavibacteriae bacterium]|nr:hypothetical protein [Ignavibacteriota bacterium]
MTPSLSRKQTEEMLPDYAFGRLGAEDSLRFEKSIEAYPDLSQELKDIQGVFSKVEKMDFNSILENRTRNISVRVQERLATKNAKNNSMSRLFRLVIPTVSIVALAIFFFSSGNSLFHSNELSSNLDGENRHIQVVHSSDASILLSEDVTLNAVLAEVVSHQNNNEINIPVQDNNVIDDLIADNLLPETEEPAETSPVDPNNLWEYLNDNEIQDILKDLSYENPSVL